MTQGTQDLMIATLRPWIRTLATRVRRSYSGRLRLDLDDLCQVGAMWALKAIPGWNPELGSWITYATPWIQEGMRQEAEFHLLKGIGKRGHYRRTRAVPQAQLMQEEIPVAPVVNENRVWLQKVLAEARLSDRELMVLERCELHEETLEAVGEDVGVSRERIRQIREKALAKLREVVL